MTIFTPAEVTLLFSTAPQSRAHTRSNDDESQKGVGHLKPQEEQGPFVRSEWNGGRIPMKVACAGEGRS
jgi:hypothetical protein